MKLFVIDKTAKVKKFLALKANTRAQLLQILGSQYFIIDGNTYHVNEVYAESEDSNTAAGAIIGGIIGILAGPIGILSGATIGGMIGNGTDANDKTRAQIFNNSVL